MTFLNPAGLWLLLGIPLLILLYIIRSKYKDRNVSSTFVWKLSSRFMKKRVHLFAFTRILLLILEILAVAAAAVLVAQPAINHLPGQDYILVFDASASMQVRGESGASRFEEAVDMARELAKTVEDGHRFSIIVAGDDAFCPLRFSTSKDAIDLSLDALSCDYGGCALNDAFELANEIAGQTAYPKVMLYTDRACTDTGIVNTEVVNVAGTLGEMNLTATGLSVRTVKKEIEFSGGIFSDGYTGTAQAILSIDGKSVDVVDVECVSGQSSTAIFTRRPEQTFTRAEMSVRPLSKDPLVVPKDGLSADDTYILCSEYVRTRKIEVIGTSPLFLYKAISLIEGTDARYVETADKAALSGYDLYIFDCTQLQLSPNKTVELPRDGAVILINTEAAEIGVKLGEERKDDAIIVRQPDVDLPLVVDFNRNDTIVDQYRVLDTSSAWKTLFTCSGEQVAAAKLTAEGFAVIAFSFDIHDTNLPMQGKFAQLIEELLEYTAPAMIKSGDFRVGETVGLHAEKKGELYIRTPEGQTHVLAVRDGEASYTPYTTGVYTALERKEDEELSSAGFFVHIPTEEGARDSITELARVNAAENPEETREAKRDVSLNVAILFLILLLCEWGVYLYEQF